MRIALVLGVGALVWAQAASAACQTGTINFVTLDGTVVRLDSGQSYEVAPDDKLHSLYWREAQDVRVCSGHTMVNDNEGGQHVEVEPLDNWP